MTLISLAVAILLMLGGIPGRSSGQAPLRLFDLTTAHGIVDDRPFRPTPVFAPGDNPIYVWFRGEGCTTGTTITSAWDYLETDPPLRFTEGEVVLVNRPGDWGQFNFELAAGRRWPLGAYRIELRVGGVLWPRHASASRRSTLRRTTPDLTTTSCDALQRRPCVEAGRRLDVDPQAVEDWPPRLEVVRHLERRLSVIRHGDGLFVRRDRLRRLPLTLQHLEIGLRRVGSGLVPFAESSRAVSRWTRRSPQSRTVR